MLTTGQVRVRVIPGTFWIAPTMNLPRSSTLSAVQRTITSYGPVTSKDSITPGTARVASTTLSLEPISDWIKMYACTVMEDLSFQVSPYCPLLDASLVVAEPLADVPLVAVVASIRVEVDI